MDRAIIHLNVADFAVAVESVVDMRLRKRPVIIAPHGAVRAVVYDMSEEAYQAGVRKGMALGRALRLCRDATVLSPHPDRYERAMQEFFRRTRLYSPIIEVAEGDGHLFLDATGTQRLFGPAPDVAWRIRKTVKSDLQLEPIWSVAPNKLVAKVATRLVKPTGEYIVEPGEEEELLYPLPMRFIPGVEAGDLFLLKEFNLTRVCHVRDLSLEQLEVVLGSRARTLYEAVRGIDRSPVLPVGQERPKAKAEHTFSDDTNETAVVEGNLYRLVERVGGQLRQRRLAARRVGITLDHSDGVRIVRQATAAGATADDRTLFDLARRALNRAWKRRVRIRHMGLVCDRLTFPPAQLELFPTDADENRRRNALATVMDRIRARFGPEAIRVGRTLA